MTNNGIGREASKRVYTLCSFAPGAVVPSVELIDADSDADAVASAQWMKPNTIREIWDRHRLVGVIAATRNV